MAKILTGSWWVGLVVDKDNYKFIAGDATLVIKLD